jgi:hypothetical protein
LAARAASGSAFEGEHYGDAIRQHHPCFNILISASLASRMCGHSSVRSNFSLITGQESLYPPARASVPFALTSTTAEQFEHFATIFSASSSQSIARRLRMLASVVPPKMRLEISHHVLAHFLCCTHRRQWIVELQSARRF